MLQRYKFSVAPELLDALSGCLFEAGALGLEEDADSLATVAEPELGELLSAAYDDFRARVALVMPTLATEPVQVEPVQADYHDGWLSALVPVQLLPGLTFCPTTHRAENRTPEDVLWFEPRPAFGAGDHPTTRLAARALADEIGERRARGLSPAHLLDLGTGSGVLSLVGLWLGVSLAVGTDISDLAREAASRNAELNGLQSRFQVQSESLPQDKQLSFDLAVANVDRQTLLDLAEGLRSRLRPGAALILTGFLEEDVPEIREAYERLGLEVYEEDLNSDWALLRLRHIVPSVA